MTLEAYKKLTNYEQIWFILGMQGCFIIQKSVSHRWRISKTSYWVKEAETGALILWFNLYVILEMGSMIISDKKELSVCLELISVV